MRLSNALGLKKRSSSSPSLVALTLSASSASEDASVGTVVGAIQGTTLGSTVTLQDDAGGLFAKNGDNIEVADALDYETATSHDITLRETLAGASNTPRDTVITITVTDVDEVAPTLSSPTASSTGMTTADVGVTTDEDDGAIYWVLTTSSSAPTKAQVKATQDHTGAGAAAGRGIAVSSSGAKTDSATGLTTNTTYYAHFMHEDAAGNQSDVSSSASFTTAGDSTAPTLSSPTASETGTTTASVGVTTDEDNGTLYWVVTTSSTGPTEAQVKAGQDHAGAAAVDDGSLAITSSGAKTDSAAGLTASTTYYAHFMHEDAATNQSTVATSASFTTDAAGSLAAPVLTATTTTENPPEWDSDFADFQTWDANTNTGDKHRMLWREGGSGGWTTEVYQELDDELLSGGFTWPLFEAAKPFAGGTFEVKEQRARYVNNVQVDESAESNTLTYTLDAPVAPEAHRYWRVQIDSVSSGSYATGAALEMSVNAGAGFSNIATGRTYANSSTAFGMPVANLFDGNATTAWHSNTSPTPHWVSVDFGSGNDVEINSIKWTERSPGTEWYQSPVSGRVQYSDDNSTWTDWYTFSGQNWSASGQQTKELSKP